MHYSVIGCGMWIIYAYLVSGCDLGYWCYYPLTWGGWLVSFMPKFHLLLFYMSVTKHSQKSRSYNFLKMLIKGGKHFDISLHTRVMISAKCLFPFLWHNCATFMQLQNINVISKNIFLGLDFMISDDIEPKRKVCPSGNKKKTPDARWSGRYDNLVCMCSILRSPSRTI